MKLSPVCIDLDAGNLSVPLGVAGYILVTQIELRLLWGEKVPCLTGANNPQEM